MSNGLAHLFGDYVVQSDHMARNKVKTDDAPEGVGAAAAHAITYAACYLPLTRDPRALAVIGGTHYVIDRWRLAKRLVWARNQIAPAASRYPWSQAGPFGQRGRPDELWINQQAFEILRSIPRQVTPDEVEGARQQVAPGAPVIHDHEADWLHGWLLFLCDNAMHLAINEWALRRWAK